METYKLIEGFENYSVSNLGNVKNNKTGRVKVATVYKCGYIRVFMLMNKQKYATTAHILVAKAFIENPENKPCVDHIDNDKSNNNVNNLRWATLSENQHNRSVNKNSSSNAKGVSYHKLSQKWVAYINIDGIRINLGSFTNIEDAKQARIIKANQSFGIYTNSCEKII